MLRNIGHQALSALSSLFLLILFVYAGRVLGDEVFGKFTLALAVAFIFQAAFDPGFYQVTIRDLAKDRRLVDQYLSNIVGYKTTIAFFTCVLLLALFAYLPIAKDTAYAILIMVAAELIKSVKTTYTSALHAYEQFQYDALLWITERVGLLVVGSFMLYQGVGLIGLTLVFAIVRIIDLSFVIRIIKQNICTPALRLDITFLRKLLIDSIPVGAFLIILNLYTYIDTVMIAAFRGNAEVGWYNAAFKIYEGLAVFPMIICNIFRPRIARSFSQHKSYFKLLFPLGIKYVLIISLLISVTGIILSDFAIITLFGEEYSRSTPALQILLSGIMFVFALTYIQMMLVAISEQKKVLKIAVIGLLFNVALNLVLIPNYGYLGAAISTIAGELLVMTFLLFYLHKMELNIPYYSAFIKPILAMVISVGSIFIIPFETSIYMNAIIVTALFIVLLFVFGAFTIQEFRHISADSPSE